jgi:hypothetical protein
MRLGKGNRAANGSYITLKIARIKSIKSNIAMPGKCQRLINWITSQKNIHLVY